MKKIVLLLGVILLLGVGCNRDKAKRAATKMVDRMSSACNFTPDEKTKMIPVVEKFIKTRVENKDKYANDQGALSKADSMNRAWYIDTLKVILTPDQLEKLKTFQAQQKMNKQGKEGNGEQE
jgi:hypothetical protein